MTRDLFRERRPLPNSHLSAARLLSSAEYNERLMAATLLFVVYCLEAGVFFIVAPWTGFWIHHPLLHLSPAVASLFDNSYFRGLVSGFGIAHLMIAVQEVEAYFFRKRRG